MENGKVFIWMQLLGFDRDDPDRGAARYLARTGFVPDGIAALFFHVDFFLQHRGMDREYTLPPDNCAYWGIPRNSERERQEWTNYDLRALSRALNAKGSGLYASVMGPVTDNAFHREWITDHPEVSLRWCVDKGGYNHFLLKRLRDGTYFEDFFIDQVCRALTDYELRGIHLADGLCPPFGGMMSALDFSVDLVEQFLDHTGLVLPEEISAMDRDDEEARGLRGEYIYRELREEWIRFSAWRWEQFFRKLTTRVHALGKEVLALAAYCTDPFETLYCLGIDLGGIVRAGVDYITTNILPTSVFVAGDGSRGDRFHRYMAIAPLTAAHLPDGHLVSMLGVQDASEEWNVLRHAPCRHERDVYSMTAYRVLGENGSRRALDGYFLCLGDGLPEEDWRQERAYLEKALTAKDALPVSPAMLWSEHAHEKMLREYIRTRRWTPHKHFYEMSEAGTLCAAALRSEALNGYSGTVFLPNFDLLSPEEQRSAAAYDRGAVIATAAPGFEPEECGIKPVIRFSDPFASYPLTAFAYGCEISDGLRERIGIMLREDDGTEDLTCPPPEAPEPTYTLYDTLTFTKVTKCFRDALALLLREADDSPFRSDRPTLVLRMPDGAFRLYIYNDSDDHYRHAFVTSRLPIARTETVTDYPVLPPRFIENASDDLTFTYNGSDRSKTSFDIKVPPAGVTVIDVYTEEQK